MCQGWWKNRRRERVGLGTEQRTKLILFSQALGPWRGRSIKHLVGKQKVCVSKIIANILGKITTWARESEERLGGISCSLVRTTCIIWQELRVQIQKCRDSYHTSLLRETSKPRGSHSDPNMKVPRRWPPGAVVPGLGGAVPGNVEIIDTPLDTTTSPAVMLLPLPGPLGSPAAKESSGLCPSVFQPGFYKGPAGSQVTLSSLGNQTRALLDDQARHLLTEQERATMMYYLDQYRGGAISVEALVMALFELLNTHAKVTCSFCPYPVTRDLSSTEP